MKLEGPVVAIDSIARTERPKHLSLVVVGSGPARDVGADRARQADQRAGRDMVVLTGELFAPRPACGAVDIMLSMGGSALRSLAFARPLVVQGKKGSWRLLTPQSVDKFLWIGWYRVGSEAVNGAATLAREIASVTCNAELQNALGAIGRKLVENRYGRATAARRQLRLYEGSMALEHVSSRWWLDHGCSSVLYRKYVLSRRAATLFGRGRVDDFNSKPVVAKGPGRPTSDRL